MFSFIERLDPRLLFAAGDLDATYGTGGIATEHPAGKVTESAIAVQGGDRVLVGGDLSISSTTSVPYLSRYLSDGKLDPSFAGAATLAGHAGVGASVDAIAVLPDDRIVVKETDANNNTVVIYLTPSGKLDIRFGKGGFARISYSSYHLGVGPDGSVFVSGGISTGDAADAVLTKLAPNGKVDTTFGTKGTFDLPARVDDIDIVNFEPSDILVRSDGEILLAGTIDDTDDDNGSFDNVDAEMITPGGKDDGYLFQAPGEGFELWGAAALLSDGTLLTLQSSSDDDDGSVATEVLVAHDSQGNLVSSFGTDGQAQVSSVIDAPGATGVQVQPDGKILLSYNGSLSRYSAAGQLDKTFGTNGVISTGDPVAGIGSDGSILQVSSVDDSGNFSLSRRFSTEGPEGLLEARDLFDAPTAPYQFSVHWRDDDGVDASSLTDGLRIIGPDGASYKARLLRTVSDSKGAVTAIYKFAPPGGTWSSADNGAYTVRVRGGKIKDIHGATAEAQSLGTFNVSIAS